MSSGDVEFGEHEYDATRDVAAMAVIGLGMVALISFGAYKDGKAAALRAQPAALCMIEQSDGDAAIPMIDGHTRKGVVLVRIGDTIYRAEDDVVPCKWLKRSANT